MRFLVTGGAGYLGSVVVPALLAEGHAVTVVGNMLYRQNSLLECCQQDTFTAVRGDARDEALMRGQVAVADVIIPLAALVGAPLCNRDKVAAETTNRDAVRLLCRLASPQQWIMMPATNSGYGVGFGELLTEDTPLNPVSVYGITKAAEAAVLERENGLTFRLATYFDLARRIGMCQGVLDTPGENLGLIVRHLLTGSRQFQGFGRIDPDFVSPTRWRRLASAEALGMGPVGRVEHCLALEPEGVGLTGVDGGWRHEAQCGVVMLVTVPTLEVAHPGLSVGQIVKPTWESGMIFGGLEPGLGVRIVVGDVWPG